MILDRTRSAATADITVANGEASIALVPQTNVDARGTGVASGNTVTFDLTWQFPPRNCSGTMQLTGSFANSGAALIGELVNRDGCDSDKEKRGTFALWRGSRATTSLAR